MNKRGKVIVIAVTIDYQLGYHSALLSALHEDGWEVHVVCTGGPLLDQFGCAPGITTHSMQMKRGPRPLADLKSLITASILFAKIRPAVLMAGTPKASLITLLAARLTRVKCRIYFLHGLKFEGSEGYLRGFLEKLEEITCSLATEIISVSESVKVMLKNHVRVQGNKIRVIGLGSCSGVDLEKFTYRRQAGNSDRNLVGLEDNTKVIGFVGRLTRDKGLPELAEALRVLTERGRELQVLVVGPVDDVSGVEGLALLNQSGQSIVSTGYITDTAMMYAYMDILVLPSLREGLPNVVLEAFASGTPVVGTKVTGIVDLIQNGRTGYLVPPRDALALADAIENTLFNESEQEAIRYSARMLVETNFDKDVVIMQQKRRISHAYEQAYRK